MRYTDLRCDKCNAWNGKVRVLTPKEKLTSPVSIRVVLGCRNRKCKIESEYTIEIFPEENSEKSLDT